MMRQPSHISVLKRHQSHGPWRACDCLLQLSFDFYIKSWGVAQRPRVAIFVFGVELCNPSMDFSNFDTPLGGVDVPFGFFEILPT